MTHYNIIDFSGLILTDFTRINPATNVQTLFFGVFHGKTLVQVEKINCFRNGSSLSLLYKIRVQKLTPPCLNKFCAGITG